MYKQTLDILMEDINDHNNIKETILKNQLKYHFTHKNTENKNVIDNTTVIGSSRLINFIFELVANPLNFPPACAATLIP